MKKKLKIISSRTYTVLGAKNNIWNFNSQRSMRYPCIRSKYLRKKYSNWRLLQGLSNNQSDYGKHSFFPGQKVYVVVCNKKTNQIKIDSDVITSLFAFGEIASGNLCNYYISKYGIGHGIDKGDLYLNKNAAIEAAKHIAGYRWEKI